MLNYLNELILVVRNVMCSIILNVLAMNMKAMFPKNQVHGIVLNALSFSRLLKKSVYI